MPLHDSHLLLVDDDPSALRVMSRLPARYPNQRMATSGVDAMRLAREHAPDLILLDADMPGMTDLDVCAALRADSGLSRVPVIFATSHDLPDLEVAALEAGAADFVTKPLVAAQITARVRSQLRRAAALRVGPGEATVPASEAGPARLLIVDDDVSAVHALRGALAPLGDFHFARNGDEALAMASELLPDIVLLDIHMPGLDGFAVCSALRADPRFDAMPIVFVTRFADPRTEMRALDLGAADFIAKPYTAAVLVARMRNLLELARSNGARAAAAGEHWRRLGATRLAGVLEAATDAILVCDATERVVLANAAACAMFGRRADEIVGSRAEAWLDEPVAAAAGGPAGRITVGGGADAVALELAVSRSGEGAEALTTLAMRDISVRERFEAESRARLVAESASRAKTAMLSFITHEMGNPLNGLLGFAQLMGNDRNQPLPPVQARRLEHVIASGRRARGMRTGARAGDDAAGIAAAPAVARRRDVGGRRRQVVGDDDGARGVRAGVARGQRVGHVGAAHDRARRAGLGQAEVAALDHGGGLRLRVVGAVGVVAGGESRGGRDRGRPGAGGAEHEVERVHVGTVAEHRADRAGHGAGAQGAWRRRRDEGGAGRHRHTDDDADRVVEGTVADDRGVGDVAAGRDRIGVVAEAGDLGICCHCGGRRHRCGQGQREGTQAPDRGASAASIRSCHRCPIQRPTAPLALCEGVPRCCCRPRMRPGNEGLVPVFVASPGVGSPIQPRLRSGPVPHAMIRATLATGSPPPFASPWLMRTLVLVAVVLLLEQARPVLLPIVIAIVFAFVLAAPVRFLRRHGVHEYVASGLVLGAVIGALVLVGALVAAPAAAWWQRAPQIVHNLVEVAQRWRDALFPYEAPASLGAGPVPAAALGERIANEGWTFTRLAIGETLSFAFSASATVILLFFLLASEHWLVARTLNLVQSPRARVLVRSGLRQAERDIGLFISTMSIVNIVLGAATGFALWAIGLPNPVLWGTTTAVLAFVPYLGPLLVTFLLLLAGNVAFGAGLAMFAPPAAFLALHCVEANFLSPMFMGHRLRLRPVFVFVAVMLWGWLWGIAGAFLAVPLLLALRALCKRVPRLRRVCAYLEAD